MSVQTELLKAASYGKAFCDYYIPDKFVDMCKLLRVLNAVRHRDIGIPITYRQLRTTLFLFFVIPFVHSLDLVFFSRRYEMLTIEVLVDRLINRSQHLLALRVCEYMDLTPDKVLVHWACKKVESAEPDEVIRDKIVDKLTNYSSISYSDIANSAFKNGKKNLAIMVCVFVDGLPFHHPEESLTRLCAVARL